VIPLFFGPREAPLFGVIDPAASPRRRRAALLLQPGGWEYLRAHRTMRLLATRLAAAGIDSMRFDYRATGDSAGSLSDEPSLDDWLDDAACALEELQSAAGVSRVSLVGLRLGARIAQLLAARLPGVVDRLVLWDPVDPAVDADTAVDGGSQPESGDLPSLHTSPAALAALPDATRSAAARSALAKQAFVLLSTGYPVPPDVGAAGPSSVEMLPDTPRCWVEERDFGAGAIPLVALRRTVELLTA